MGPSNNDPAAFRRSHPNEFVGSAPVVNHGGVSVTVVGPQSHENVTKAVKKALEDHVRNREGR